MSQDDDKQIEPETFIVEDQYCEIKKEDTPLEVCKAAEFCSFITQKDGPFAPCHSLLNPRDYYESCVRDICENGIPSICPSTFIYSDACKAKANICIPWRSSEIGQAACPIECGGEPDMTWTECVDPCQRTYCHEEVSEKCAERRELTGENGLEWEAKELVSTFLRCPLGQTFDINTFMCIEECPVYCTYNSRFFTEGETFNNGCSVCECLSSGKVSCSKMVCPTYETFVCPATGMPAEDYIWDENGCCQAPKCQDVCTCTKKIEKPVCENSCEQAIIVATDDNCCPVYECKCPEIGQDIPVCTEKYQVLTADSSCCNNLICQCQCPEVDPNFVCPFGQEIVIMTDESSSCNCQYKNCQRIPGTCVFENDGNSSFSRLLSTDESITNDEKCEICTCLADGSVTCQPRTCQLSEEQFNDYCTKGWEPEIDSCGCPIENSCTQKYCVDNDGVFMNATSTRVQNDPCMTCECGEDFCLKCNIIECPALPESCVKTTTPEGQCCPICLQDNHQCTTLKTQTLSKIGDSCIVLDANNNNKPGTVDVSYCAGTCESESYFDYEQEKFVSSCGCCNPKRTSFKELTVKCRGKIEKMNLEVAEECHCNCGSDTCAAPSFADIFF